MMDKKRLLILCERDVGLFSLIQQVISHIPLAQAEDRIPIAYFGPGCCYWTPGGYKDRDTVWEYYFEPLVAGYDSAWIPRHIKEWAHLRFQPRPVDWAPPWPLRRFRHLEWAAYYLAYLAKKPGFDIDRNIHISNHFGDHWRLKRKTLAIPFRWRDPDPGLRRRASGIIRDYIIPRDYIREKAEDFYRENMRSSRVIGLHIRGTDATSDAETRLFRRNSLDLPSYKRRLAEELERTPDGRVFVATDEEDSLSYIREAFGKRVVACNSLRHRQGDRVTGLGPIGGLMPGYIANNRCLAPRNGEEAVLEWLLLCRCDLLIHNGSSLARTVLLANPDMEHVNTHPRGAGLLGLRKYRGEQSSWRA